MAAPTSPLIRPSVAGTRSTPVLNSSSRPPINQRRSTLKRSRDDSTTMDLSSSPSKRSRVTFDPDIEFLSADDEDDLDPLVVREEVRRAIQRHLIGDDDAYERVQTIFKMAPRAENAPSTNAVRIHLHAVLANISSLNKSCSGLVNAILLSEWVGRDERCYALYVRFLGNLAAAQSGYLAKMLYSLVELLGRQKTRRLPECKPVRQREIHLRASQTIQYLIRLIPPASTTLAQVVQKKLSFDFAEPEERTMCTRNIMELMSYIPELKADILAIITSELVKMDVSVQVDLEDEDDDLSDELLQDVSSSQTLVTTTSQSSQRVAQKKVEEEDDEGSTTDESDLEDEAELNPSELRRRKLKANVQQVDSVMDLIFQYYDNLILSSTLEVRDNATEQLISHFNNIILPTYRSRHPQFLVFHFAQTSPVLVDRFVTSCISIMGDKAQPPVLRQSAAAYLAGFVGRGAHVSSTVVKDSFTLLCEDLNDLRKENEPGCRGPDLKRFNNFYATMQAILYIFCFRWRDIATASSDMDDDNSDEEELEEYHFPDFIRDTLISAIFSPLNPLRVCTPAIVEQFAKISNHLRFLYLFTKIEANKHVRLTSTRYTISDLGMNQPDRDLSWVGENGMMEGYFPYDPYQLPLSRRWVQGDYVEWKGIPEANDDENDSEEGEEDEDMLAEDGDEAEETATEEENA